MPQTVAWPVNVDMSLIRSREKVVMEKLRSKFKSVDEILKLSSRGMHDFTSADQERFHELVNENQEEARDYALRLVESDPVLKALEGAVVTLHTTILTQNVLDELFGFGPLGPLLRDTTVFDIWIKKYDDIYIERNGHLEKSTVFFEDEHHLRLTIAKIVAPLGFFLSEESPVVRAILPNGSWVVASLPPKGTGAICLISCARTDDRAEH